MTEWYYADRQRQQHGPVDGAELARLFQAGQIDAATLVWRDGLPDWRPLSGVREELGLEPPPTLDFRTDAAAPATPMAAAGPALSEAAYTVPDAPAADAAGAYSPYAAPSAPLASAHADPVLGGEVVMAGLWRRFAASVIDGLVTAMASYALLIPLMLAFGISLQAMAQSELAGTGASITFMLLQYAIQLGVPTLYFAWMHSSRHCASLGKMAVGAKVVRSNGEPISFNRALLRYLAYILFALVTCGLGVLISGLMVAFTERKQALHDMLCDTVVVDKWAFTDHPEWQQRGLGVVTIVVLVISAAMAVLAIMGVIALLSVLGNMLHW